MQNTTHSAPLSTVSAISTMAAPLLLAASSIAWAASGQLGAPSGTFQMWAMIAFAIGIPITLHARLDEIAPTARAVLTVMLFIGACAGAGFAVEIAMADVRGVERLVTTGEPQAILLLNLPGIIFPLSLMGTALVSARAGVLGRASAALLFVGALLFPIARIPEVGAIAVVGDAVLSLALVPIGLAALKAGRDATVISTTSDDLTVTARSSRSKVT